MIGEDHSLNDLSCRHEMWQLQLRRELESIEIYPLIGCDLALFLFPLPSKKNWFPTSFKSDFHSFDLYRGNPTCATTGRKQKRALPISTRMLPTFASECGGSVARVWLKQKLRSVRLDNPFVSTILPVPLPHHPSGPIVVGPSSAAKSTCPRALQGGKSSVSFESKVA